MIAIKHNLCRIFCIHTGLASQTIFKVLSVCILALLLSSCGGSNDSASGIRAGKGELIVGLTDSEGDFVSYTVDVTSITLTKANGAIVNVLPLTTRVDFAQYTELTEFLTASMVPLGAYKQVTMILDYTNAEIWAENADGDAVQVNTFQDTEGNPVTELEMSVHLVGRNKLVISRGVPAHLTLDFDLNATNKVTFNEGGVPTQIIDPYLIADVALQKPKTRRLRGTLNNVDVVGNSFDIIIQPFHHQMHSDQRFGELTVSSDERTIYDIDQLTYEGADGLQVLDSLAQGSPVIVIGKYQLNPWRFIAREVYAGTSVPGGSLDVVTGNVIARNGNTLSVKGATLIRSGGMVSFNDEVEVTVAVNTLVKKQLSTDIHTIDEISVGQKVTVFGIIADDGMGHLLMDATNGVVRMKITKVGGTTADALANAASPYFVVNVQHFNRRSVDMFDFSGTGINETNDADPFHYEVNSGQLMVDDIGVNTPVRVHGFVTPFGMAPADFLATSIVDLTKVPAVLTMNWTPDTEQPFSQINDNSVTLSLLESGVFHHVGRGGAVVNLQLLSPAPVIQEIDGNGWYEIKEKGTRQSYTNFNDFISEIKSRLLTGSTMKRIVAQGYFNDVSATLSADTVHAMMK